VIAIDVDEVLVDFMGECQRLFKALGLPAYVATGRYDVYAELDELRRTVFLGLGERANRMQAFEHAHEVLTELRKLDKVVALTAPWSGSETWHRARVVHLLELGFKESEIVFCPGELKQYFAADILIEDRTETLIQWANRNPLGSAICLATPWNTLETPALDELSNAYLAKTPQDIVRIAKKDYEK